MKRNKAAELLELIARNDKPWLPSISQKGQDAAYCYLKYEGITYRVLVEMGKKPKP